MNQRIYSRYCLYCDPQRQKNSSAVNFQSVSSFEATTLLPDTLLSMVSSIIRDSMLSFIILDLQVSNDTHYMIRDAL